MNNERNESSVATSEKKAEKMIKIFGSVGVTVEEITCKGDEALIVLDFTIHTPLYRC